jgi:hypothetical protein
MGEKHDQSGRHSGSVKSVDIHTYTEKNGWQMDARNTGMVFERM